MEGSNAFLTYLFLFDDGDGGLLLLNSARNEGERWSCVSRSLFGV